MAKEKRVCLYRAKVLDFLGGYVPIHPPARREVEMPVYLRNGNYYIDYSLPNGKRKREMIGPDKKLAEIVLYKKKVEIAEGKFLDIDKKENIKFEDFANEYLNIHAKQHKKSWKTDFHIIKILKRFFKGKYLYEIGSQDIEYFKISRQKETVGLKEKDNPRTISNATVKYFLCPDQS